jgi:hypothetical protein
VNCFVGSNRKPRNIISIWFLQEEPGGQRALIFDQGNRISQVRVIYSY